VAKRIIQVTAPSRLHFGMLSFGQPGRRQFGGAGVMIGDPRLRLTISGSDRFQVIGPLGDRVERFVAHLSQHATWWPAVHGDRPRTPLCIEVQSSPPQHVGLGSGTQLGMALAMGLAAWFDAPPQTAASLAQAAGRGKRSAVGVHGACKGGFIAESGKLREEELSPLTSRVALPDEWRFAVIVPGDSVGLCGEAEQRAFDRLPPVTPETTDALGRELVCEILPAARAGDFDRFSEGLFRYGRLAGQCFAAEQEGVYASAAVERLVECCCKLGVRGVGQSSWGPAVFSHCRDQQQAQKQLQAQEVADGSHRLQTFLGAPDNRGIRVERHQEDGLPRPSSP
jgi:beta-ribofuranosylaminobenzene 5'-phosphate synthase